MTTPQRITMMAEWWPAACRGQGWKASDRNLRLRVISVAVSFSMGHFNNILDCLAVINSSEPLRTEITSASQLNQTDDVDRVKALLLFLAGNLKATQELDNHEGSARRTRHVIVQERLRCLALYPLTEPMGLAGAEKLLAKLLRDFVNKGRRFETVTLDDLSEDPQFYRRKGSTDWHEGPSQLQRVIMRLDALLNTNNKKTGKQGYRAAAGHSLHDMKTAAGLPCDCAGICRVKAMHQAAVPAGADEAETAVEMLEEGDPF